MYFHNASSWKFCMFIFIEERRLESAAKQMY